MEAGKKLMQCLMNLGYQCLTFFYGFTRPSHNELKSHFLKKKRHKSEAICPVL